MCVCVCLCLSLSLSVSVSASASASASVSVSVSVLRVRVIAHCVVPGYAVGGSVVLVRRRPCCDASLAPGGHHSWPSRPVLRASH